LDAKALSKALNSTAKAARAWKLVPDPREQQARTLQKKAQLAADAARVRAEADQSEKQLEEMQARDLSRADLQLGALLVARKIKPATVVIHWSSSKGEHQNELSKAEFRGHVLGLGVRNCTADDVDAVFDQYDEDGGGYMDAEEAALMVKGLQLTAERAERERRTKARESRAIRARAIKKAQQAFDAPGTEPATGGLSPGRASRRSASPTGSPAAMPAEGDA